MLYIVEDSIDSVERSELLVLEVLPPYVGPKFALLVRRLGFRTMGELAQSREIDLSSLSGFGAVRMEQLRQALTDHGLSFKPAPIADLMPRIRRTMSEWSAIIQPEPNRRPHPNDRAALCRTSSRIRGQRDRRGKEGGR